MEGKESAKAEDSESLLVGCVSSFTVLLEDIVVIIMIRGSYTNKISIRACLSVMCSPDECQGGRK